MDRDRRHKRDITYHTLRPTVLHKLRKADRKRRQCHGRCRLFIWHSLRLCSAPLRAHTHFFTNSTRTCVCRRGTEDARHFLLHCPRWTRQRVALFAEVRAITATRPDLRLLLAADTVGLLSADKDAIASATIRFVEATRRFDA